MATQYFRRDHYSTNVISKKFYEEWKELNPQYSEITYKEFKNIWKSICEEIYHCILDNPSGIDLPLFLGNLSVRILDKEFKCAADFPVSAYTPTGKKEDIIRAPYITSDIPKLVKICWTKHATFKGALNLMGVENSKEIKKVVSAGVRNNTHKYEKAFKYSRKKSKCEDKPVKGLFDD